MKSAKTNLTSRMLKQIKQIVYRYYMRRNKNRAFIKVNGDCEWMDFQNSSREVHYQYVQ